MSTISPKGPPVVFCRDCIYQALQPNHGHVKNHPEAFCKMNFTLNYVTGGHEMIQCKYINTQGVCSLYCIEWKSEGKANLKSLVESLRQKWGGGGQNH